jgi:hypothetical protein
MALHLGRGEIIFKLMQVGDLSCERLTFSYLLIK